MISIAAFLTMLEALEYIQRNKLNAITNKELDGRYHVYVMD